MDYTAEPYPMTQDQPSIRDTDPESFTGYGSENCGSGNLTSNCMGTAWLAFHIKAMANWKLGDGTALCGKDSAGGKVSCPLNVCCSYYGYCGVSHIRHIAIYSRLICRADRLRILFITQSASTLSRRLWFLQNGLNSHLRRWFC